MRLVSIEECEITDSFCSSPPTKSVTAHGIAQPYGNTPSRGVDVRHGHLIGGEQDAGDERGYPLCGGPPACRSTSTTPSTVAGASGSRGLPATCCGSTPNRASSVSPLSRV